MDALDRTIKGLGAVYAPTRRAERQDDNRRTRLGLLASVSTGNLDSLERPESA